jgi:hypothetical protein
MNLGQRTQTVFVRLHDRRVYIIILPNRAASAMVRAGYSRDIQYYRVVFFWLLHVQHGMRQANLTLWRQLPSAPGHIILLSVT